MENAPHQEAFRRTKLCKFDLLGACTRGDECAFAHGFESLRPQPDLYRTRICAHFLRSGRCDAGSHCRYAHSQGELRPAPRGVAPPCAELAVPGLLPQRRFDSPASPPPSTPGCMLDWQQLRQRTGSPPGGDGVVAPATTRHKKKRSEAAPQPTSGGGGSRSGPTPARPLRAEVVNLHRALQSMQARPDAVQPTVVGAQRPQRPGRQRERRRRPDRQERLCEEAERLRRRLRQKWEEAARQRTTTTGFSSLVQPAPGLVVDCTPADGASGSSSQSSEASSEPQGHHQFGSGGAVAGLAATQHGTGRSYLVKNTFVELEDDSSGSPACASRRAKSAASRLALYSGAALSTASDSSGSDEDDGNGYGDDEEDHPQEPPTLLQPPTPSKLPLPVLLGRDGCPAAVAWRAEELRQLPIKNTFVQFEEAVRGSPQNNLRKCRSAACLGGLADESLADEEATSL
eukprot:TRINITY_DN59831_c0_g1_i1.p1 TRINITY_DN59831_c0_g1~~TRINITY_DN59831_c0_g1_i1.p1  ORF type:complete len:505 (-),score=78.73 TRINITY_DN59831_c0_g1_i1:56-1429(-)